MLQSSNLKTTFPRSERSWLVRATKFIIFTLSITIAYAIMAKLSITFATLPGKVTAVWLPSGLTTALVAWFGKKALPGIALGSIVGSLPDLLTMNPLLTFFSIIFLNLTFALANCLQPVVNISIINWLTGLPPTFKQLRSVIIFILSTPVGPAISATIGITSLCLVQAASWESYDFSWLTWWLSSTLANLLFTPPLLLWQKRSTFNLRLYWVETILILVSSLVLGWLVFIKGYPVGYVFLPVLIWAVFRGGAFFGSLLVSIISIMAILTTSWGLGSYVTNSPTQSLLLLQSFVGVCSITTLVLAVAIDERKTSELALQQTLASLEQQVTNRTAELRAEINDRKQLEIQLKLQARQDQLTTISNRLHFKEASELEWRRCKRNQQPFSLILLDIDEFKNYNDTYGHVAGDACLVQIAKLLQTVVGRAGDLVARYGGEEFIILLSETSAVGAAHVAGLVRQRLQEQQIPHQGSSVSDYVTVSLGVATCVPNANLQVDDVIQLADKALYESKRQGRDCMKLVSITEGASN
jgi:diguanylate cyclase (GGDEF)-like protein